MISFLFKIAKQDLKHLSVQLNKDTSSLLQHIFALTHSVV